MAMPMASLLLVAIPIVGATLGMLMWRNPQALKVWLLHRHGRHLRHSRTDFRSILSGAVGEFSCARSFLSQLS